MALGSELSGLGYGGGGYQDVLFILALRVRVDARDDGSVPAPQRAESQHGSLRHERKGKNKSGGCSKNLKSTQEQYDVWQQYAITILQWQHSSTAR